MFIITSKISGYWKPHPKHVALYKQNPSFSRPTQKQQNIQHTTSYKCYFLNQNINQTMPWFSKTFPERQNEQKMLTDQATYTSIYTVFIKVGIQT